MRTQSAGDKSENCRVDARRRGAARRKEDAMITLFNFGPAFGLATTTFAATLDA
jgi:hypothetical protein